VIQRVPRRVGTERGIALLSALLTVALLTVIVIEMTDATLVHSHLTRNAGNAMAAQLLARSAAIAGEALVGNKDANPPDRTCDKNLWATPFFLPAGAGTVALQISDEGGKLDLNGVLNPAYRKIVETLFDDLGLGAGLVSGIAAWITPSGDGAMATGPATDYCALSMPCAPRQQPLNSLEELRLIRGFSEQTIARLRPYATVIPPVDAKAAKAAKTTPLQVNVLTAKLPVLKALGCDGSEPVPDCSASSTGTGDAKGKDSWGTTYSEWQKTNCKDVKQFLGTQSSLFLIDAHGVVGDMEQGLRVLVQRTGNKVRRLSWQERPVTDVLPTEVR